MHWNKVKRWHVVRNFILSTSIPIFSLLHSSDSPHLRFPTLQWDAHLLLLRVLFPEVLFLAMQQQLSPEGGGAGWERCVWKWSLAWCRLELLHAGGKGETEKMMESGWALILVLNLCPALFRPQRGKENEKDRNSGVSWNIWLYFRAVCFRRRLQGLVSVCLNGALMEDCYSP